MYKQSVLLVYTTYSSVAKCTGCMSICMFEITSCQLHFQNETAATYFWVTTHLPPTMHQVTRFKSPGPHDVQESARCDQDKICTGTCVWITIKFENEATVSDLLLVHDTPPPPPSQKIQAPSLMVQHLTVWKTWSRQDLSMYNHMIPDGGHSNFETQLPPKWINWPS